LYLGGVCFCRSLDVWGLGMKRRVFLVFCGVVAALCVGLGACFLKSTAPSVPQNLEPVEVVFGLAAHVPSAAVFVAKNQGLFEKHGVRVQFKPFPSGARALSAMFAGEVQMVNVADVPVAAAGLTRKDFKIFAQIATADSDARIVARRDRGVELPVDLAGKKICTQKLSALHYFLYSFLTRYGISDVKEVFLKPEDFLEAFRKGEVDACSMREPFLGQALAALGDKAVMFDARNLYVRSEFLVARDDVMASKPQAIERVLRAVVEAEAFVRGNREKAIDIVAAELKGDRKRIAEDWSDLSVEVQLGQSILTTLETEGQWALRYPEGTAKSALPNYLSIIDASFLGRVSPFSVTLIR
jgi:sulfonate transport system substrate-binding protein